MELFFVVRHVL